MADDTHRTHLWISLKRGVKMAGWLLTTHDHLAISAMSLFGFGFIIGLAIF